jgi:Ca-activated chloride channel family protein
VIAFELARPAWLWLLGLLPAWWWYVRPHRTWGLLVARGDAAGTVSLGRVAALVLEGAPRAMRAGAAACLIVSLARPQLVRTIQEQRAEGVGIAVALDLSTSMWALDMGERTTRMQVAKEAAQRFVASRRADDDVGLVAFAGEAHVRLPLTHDKYVVEQAVSTLEVGLLLDGTDIAGAIATGAGLLKDAEQRTKMLILVTDGAHNRAGMVPGLAARAATTFGVKIYPIAIGSEEALQRGGAGMETVLVQAARISGGRYFRATDVSALDAIYGELDRLAVPSQVPVERSEISPLGHWLLLAGLTLLVGGIALRGSPWGVLP